jgi:K(+)-stimulated pyrophosphate-energized sodium pump
VALNPIIKFSTLFGLLAVEISIPFKKAYLAGGTNYIAMVGVVMLAIALVFVWRSFYAMRIPPKEDEGPKIGGGGTAGAADRETAHTH